MLFGQIVILSRMVSYNVIAYGKGKYNIDMRTQRGKDCMVAG